MPRMRRRSVGLWRSTRGKRMSSLTQVSSFLPASMVPSWFLSLNVAMPLSASSLASILIFFDFGSQPARAASSGVRWPCSEGSPPAHIAPSCAVIASLLCLVVLLSDGPVAGYAALAIGFFNSIMFPTIFTITLERSGVSRSSTSGILCLAIFGGALLPMAVGAMADRFGLSLSFVVPLAAYAFIALFALAARSSARTVPIAAERQATASPIP